MCGRFTLVASGEAVAEHFDLSEVPHLAPRYNIAPTQPVAAVRVSEQSGQRELTHFHWGLIPFWAKDPSIGSRMINARSETAAEKPSFRAAFKYRRCLIPADGFYEWQRLNGQKQPVRVQLQDGGLFALAGLWEHWQGSDGSEIESCTILTTKPNDLVAEVHNRMPVILAPEDYDLWLDRGAQHPAEVQPLLDAYPSEALRYYQVSTHVNNPRNDDPSCIEPL
ncbi:MAG: SOS response-associated peptidase [Candidatus Promineifilaceae bacterium]|nr:SOS response-associated peptidase [Candidatus Promineifilaceae bacterium]